MESEGAGWLGIDLGSVSTDELELELGRLESLIRQARSVQLGLIGEADRRQVPLGDGCRDTAEWVAAHLDVSAVEAKRLVRLLRRLPGLPEMAERFGKGELSLGRAEALSRVATAESETGLAGEHEGSGPGGHRTAGGSPQAHRSQPGTGSASGFLCVVPAVPGRGLGQDQRRVWPDQPAKP